MVNGVSRPVDDLGRIVIPMEIRRAMSIQPGDRLDVMRDGGKIIIRPVLSACTCIICGSAAAGHKYNGRNICVDCEEKIADGEFDK